MRSILLILTVLTRGCRIVVVPQLPKLEGRVRFPSPAQKHNKTPCRPETITPSGLPGKKLQRARVIGTKKQISNEDLRATELNYQQIIDHACEGVLIHVDDRIRYVNQRMSTMLGYENIVDLLDSSVSDLVQESRRSISRELESNMLDENDGLTSIEEVYVKKDGSPLSVEISVYPIIFRDENAVQVIARDITERKKVEAEIWEYQSMLKRVASDLILAEESEKRKLAIVLHDHLGQSLAMAKIKISGLMNALDGEEQKEKLKAIEDDISAAVKQTRSLTNDLSPPVLHELGLIVAIRWRMDKFMTDTGIDANYEHNVDSVTLRDEQSIILFRSTDEILNNIVKHAEASQVKIMVDVDRSSMIIMISDDGKGFDLSILNPEKRRNDSFGLFSIKERLEYLGGVLDIQSEPKKGTRVILSIPISSGGA